VSSHDGWDVEFCHDYRAEMLNFVNWMVSKGIG
jgi:hypothetical protein